MINSAFTQKSTVEQIIKESVRDSKLSNQKARESG